MVTLDGLGYKFAGWEAAGGIWEASGRYPEAPGNPQAEMMCSGEGTFSFPGGYNKQPLWF